MARPALALSILVLAVPPLAGQGKAYLEDFEFLEKTVREHGAALAAKKIDWRRACAEMQPLFAACRDDVEHVKNVMRLLAVLRDSHTGVTRSSVAWEKLPSKWDGLYGGGILFGWEDGRIMVRGIMEGHALAASIPAGSALVAIDGLPAWLVMEREKRRITTHQGSSSDHSLFASMGNRLLPFGERGEIGIAVLTPELEVKTAKVPRWGPGGKAFYQHTVELPDGIGLEDGAAGGMLSLPWCGKVGYLRITGRMDEATMQRFHEEMDALEGLEALLLDTRGMGGGGDPHAWNIAGRFFAKAEPNGRHGRIEPTGSWPFTGPVVMLQDELQVSSAETFVWAMSETGRALSVGRPTGGWGIIPRGYACPSGLVSFRLGVNDRPTPIRGVHTEGVGWPPDVLVPWGPVVCARRDPVREIGTEALRLLHAGTPRSEVVKRLAEHFGEDLARTLRMERALLVHADVPAPDVLGAQRRLPGLAERARQAGLKGELGALEKAVRALGREARAQEDLLELLGQDFTADDKAKSAWLRRHARTRLARVVQGL